MGRKRTQLLWAVMVLPSALILTGCPPTKPDYQVKQVKATAAPENTGHSKWSFVVTVDNIGGIAGIVEDETTPNPPTEIPVLFTADFDSNSSNCAGHPALNIDKTVQKWTPILTTTPRQIAFSNVFDIPTVWNNKTCVPKYINVQFDTLLPTYASTIEESNERNNINGVEISNYPQTHIWYSP